MKIYDRAITIAREYVGEKETKANDGDWLQTLMSWGGNPAGWLPGQPYCIAALLAIFARALKEAGKVLPFTPSASSQTAYANAKAKGLVSDIPEIGDIAIYQLGTSWQGHAELVTSILKTDKGFPYGINTIGFNTGGKEIGDQRNGEGCFAKSRLFSHFSPGKAIPGRLWIKGYIKSSQF